MMLITPFGPDVRRAINASWPRRIASAGSMLLMVGLSLMFGASTPWWIWAAAIVLDGALFASLGNRWAAADAAEADEPTTRG